MNQIPPEDARVAALSFARRLRSAFEENTDGIPAEGVAAAWRIAHRLRGADADLRRILVSDDPSLEDHAIAGDTEDLEDPEGAVEAVEAAAKQLSSTISATPAPAWGRSGRRGDGSAVTAQDVLSAAITASSADVRVAAGA